MTINAKPDMQSVFQPHTFMCEFGHLEIFSEKVI